MRRNPSKITALLLLGIFALFYCGNALFFHTHIIGDNGGTLPPLSPLRPPLAFRAVARIHYRFQQLPVRNAACRRGMLYNSRPPMLRHCYSMYAQTGCQRCNSDYRSPCTSGGVIPIYYTNVWKIP